MHEYSVSEMEFFFFFFFFCVCMCLGLYEFLAHCSQGSTWPKKIVKKQIPNKSIHSSGAIILAI